LGLVVKGAKPARSKGNIGWCSGDSGATGHAGRPSQLAELVHTHGGDHRRGLSSEGGPRTSERRDGADSTVDTG
jgi:hypothetical protein